MTKKTSARRVTARSTGIEVRERITRLETLMEAQLETNKAVAEGISSIQTSLTKYKGFWGAITLIGGAIAALIGFLKEPLMKKFGIS